MLKIGAKIVVKKGYKQSFSDSGKILKSGTEYVIKNWYSFYGRTKLILENNIHCDLDAVNII